MQDLLACILVLSGVELLLHNLPERDHLVASSDRTDIGPR